MISLNSIWLSYFLYQSIIQIQLISLYLFLKLISIDIIKKMSPVKLLSKKQICFYVIQ